MLLKRPWSRTASFFVSFSERENFKVLPYPTVKGSWFRVLETESLTKGAGFWGPRPEAQGLLTCRTTLQLRRLGVEGP